MVKQQMDINPLLELSYEWEMTDIDKEERILYSKNFVHQKTTLFRAGMKMAATHLPSNPAILFLMTTNLQKMGLRVQAVSYIAHNFRSWKQSRWKKKDLTMTSRNKINNDEDENGAAGLQFSSLASWITIKFNK